MSTAVHGHRPFGVRVIDVAINLFIIPSVLDYIARSDDAGGIAFIGAIMSMASNAALVLGGTLILVDLFFPTSHVVQWLAGRDYVERIVMTINLTLLLTVLYTNQNMIIGGYVIGESFGTNLSKDTLLTALAVLWGVFRLTYRISRWALLKRREVRGPAAAS